MRADIATGAVFPDYELTDHAGNAASFPRLVLRCKLLETMIT
jgi:hypothetical protein